MEEQKHWLVRPENIRLMWRGFMGILALTVLAELGIHGHPYFGVDGLFGFYAVYGFITCVGMVLFAKALGIVLKRPDTYYDD